MGECFRSIKIFQNRGDRCCLFSVCGSCSLHGSGMLVRGPSGGNYTFAMTGAQETLCDNVTGLSWFLLL